MKPVAPRRLPRLVLLALLAGSVSSSQASPAEALHAVQARLHALEQQLFHTEARRQDTAAALRDADAAIRRTNQALAHLAAQKQRADADLAAEQARLAQLETHIQQSQQQLGRQLAAQYQAGQADPVLLLLNQRDPGAASRQLVYYQYLSRARSQRIASLRQDLGQARQLAAAEAQKQQEIAQIERRQAAQKQLLETAQQHRRLLLASLSTRAAGQRHQISRLKQDAQRLSQLVDRLRHAPPPRLTPAHPAPGHPLPPAPAIGSGAFAQLKGRLPLPVAGRIYNHFGSPRAETGIPWKGILILASPGQPVKAVAAGRIVYASWLRGFGNLLIIDHGHGYMSLYGNNQLISRHTGELVHAGDTIALVGNSGNNKEPGVYYELRYQGKPLDPLGWSAAGH